MVSSPGPSASNADSSSRKEVFHRLVRTMSGRSLNEAGSPSTPATSGAETTPVLHRTESASSSTSQSKGKRRMSIGEKLKKLAKDIPLGNLKSKSVPASPKVSTANLVAEVDTARPVQSSHAKMLSMVTELTETDESSSVSSSSATSPNPANNTPSPGTLARRLQELIDALPFPDYSNQPIKNPKPPARDKKGRPIAPPNASPIKDSKLIALLQSATFMNGGKAGLPRKSIWDVLEHLGVPPHGFPEADEPQPERRAPDEGGSQQDEPTPDSPDIFTDNSSIMVYSPLIPGLDDHVELAELVPVGFEEEFIDEPAAGPTAWTSVWPLSLISGAQPEEAVPSSSSNIDTSFLSGDVVYSPAITTIDDLGRKVRVKTVRAWVPSTTKLSFQAMWWGYRLWLPPPVLEILSDKTLEATKRAAMITAALSWFFNHLPIDLLPLPVRPAALLMQRIVPYLGYIGTFISWSWSTIKSYDMGHGVTLTATWLLPIALIPGTWFERDLPQSPPQSPPANLPNSPAPSTPNTPSTPPATTPAPDTPAQPPSTTPASPAPTDPPTTTPAPTQPPPPSSPPVGMPPLGEPPPITVPSTPPTQDVPATPSDPSATPLPPKEPPPTGGGFKKRQKPITSPKALAKKLFSSGTPMKVASIPIPAVPIEPVPVPPTPSTVVNSPSPQSPAPVVLGSPLGEQLLHGPVLGTVPLPEEDLDEAPEPQAEVALSDSNTTTAHSRPFFGRFGF